MTAPTRNADARRRWLAGLPAVVALAGGAAVVGWLWSTDPAGRADWYASTADAAFDAHDYRTATVCYSRLDQLRPGDPATAYRLAVSLENVNQGDLAGSLLVRLAPPDDPAGYRPAHLRLARRDLSADHPTPAELADADRHLAPALRSDPTDPAANFWQAILLAARGKWDQVPAAADRAGPVRPQLAARLARIAKAQGDARRADEWARAAGA